MVRYSRVSEHLDTKFVVEAMSSGTSHGTVTLLKCRPSGRSNNRSVTDWSPSFRSNLRDPVNLGEVGGLFHASCLLRASRETNVRSSRRWKEQMKLKISEFWRCVKLRWSDVTTGENPCNGTRGIRASVHELVSNRRCTTLQNVRSVSVSTAVIGTGYKMDRVCVF